MFKSGRKLRYEDGMFDEKKGDALNKMRRLSQKSLPNYA